MPFRVPLSPFEFNRSSSSGCLLVFSLYCFFIITIDRKACVLLAICFGCLMRWKARSPLLVETISEARSTAWQFLPSAVLVFVSALHSPDFARTSGWFLATPYQFLAAFFFCAFCFCFSLSRKYVMPLLNFIFTVGYQNCVGPPYLIPRNETTIIASSCHVDLCPIL